MENNSENMIKKDGIIPILKVENDETQVEKEYQWFLDWLKYQFNETIEVERIGTMNYIPNPLNGRDLSELNLIDIFDGYFYHSNNNIYCHRLITCNKPLYYYLKKRNIIVTNDGNDWWWIYNP